MQPESITRTGQRHIGQAQLFGEDFPARALQVFLQCIAAKIQQRQALLIMAAGAVAVLAQQLAVPEEGAEHQRVFQALAGVDGDDLHPFGIAFQSQQRILTGPLAAALGVEPAQQGFKAGAQQAFSLQQFTKMQQIGQPPLTIDPRQQPLGHSLFVQPGAEHTHEALLLPELVVTLGGFALGIPLLLIILAAGEIGGAATQQARGQGVAQQAFAARLGIGGQHGSQLARLLTAPDAVAPTPHAGHATRGQLIGDHPGLAMVGHQHGDITALERRELAVLVEAGTALGGSRQLQGDAPGAVAGRQLGSRALGQGIVIEPDQRQRRCNILFIQAQGRPRFVGSTNRRILQVHLGKRLRMIEQQVQCIDQLRRRTVIGRQVVGLFGLFAGLDIGRQVGAAKGIDGLFGIADETQRGGAALGIDTVEDGVLDRVGVLKLIDQRQRVGAAQGSRQLIAHRPLQRLVKAVEQIVERQQTLRRLALGQLPIEPFEQRDLQRDQPLFACRQRFGQRIT